MYEEIFEGCLYTNEELAKKFDTTFRPVDEETRLKHRDMMVLVKDIRLFSTCEHHLAPMYNLTGDIAYIPKGKVMGLSKIPRIAQMVCRRPQLQERIASDIVEVMSLILGHKDIAVRITGEHACMSMRGVRDTKARMRTTLFDGVFLESVTYRAEFLRGCD